MEPLTVQRIFRAFVGTQQLAESAESIATATRAYPDLFRELSTVLQDAAARGREGDTTVLEAVNVVVTRASTPEAAGGICDDLLKLVRAPSSKA